MKRKESLGLSPVDLHAALQPFGVGLTSTQANQVIAYVSLLIKWNQTVSLTSVTDPSEILTRHFGESMFGARIADLSAGRLADVGSGAGFPGLPLKILSPALDVTLIESNGRKCSFLKEVVRSLCLQGVTVCHQRLDSYQVDKASLDFVTARATGQFDHILRWAADALRGPGRLILWVSSDMAGLLVSTPGWSWSAPASVPKSSRRVILVGRPLQVR